MNNIDNVLQRLTNTNEQFKNQYSEYMDKEEVGPVLKEYLHKAHLAWENWIKEVKFLIKAHAYALKVNYNDNCYQELVSSMLTMMNRDKQVKDRAFDTNSYHNDIITEIRQKIIQFEKVAIGVEKAYELSALKDMYNKNVDINQSYLNDVWSKVVRTIKDEETTCFAMSEEEFMDSLQEVESRIDDTVRSNIRRYWNVQWLESTEQYGVIRQINEHDEVYLSRNPAEVRTILNKEMNTVGIDTSN